MPDLSTSTSSTNLTFYPAFYFPVSPTFNSWTKLTAFDVHALKKREGFQGQNIYFHLNHPIKYVRLVGIIVGFEDILHRHILHLDDSSGASIEITCPRERSHPPPVPTNGTTAIAAQFAVPLQQTTLSTKGRTVSGNTIDLAGIDVGTVIKVKGGITEFRGEKQITLERFTIISTTTAEAQAWNELHEFRTTVLAKPWVVSSEEQQRLKEELEGARRKEEERLRRKKHREHKEAKRKAHEEAKEVKKKVKPERSGPQEGEARRKEHDEEKRSKRGTKAEGDAGKKEKDVRRMTHEENKGTVWMTEVKSTGRKEKGAKRKAPDADEEIRRMAKKEHPWVA